MKKKFLSKLNQYYLNNSFSENLLYYKQIISKNYMPKPNIFKFFLKKKKNLLYQKIIFFLYLKKNNIKDKKKLQTFFVIDKNKNSAKKEKNLTLDFDFRFINLQKKHILNFYLKSKRVNYFKMLQSSLFFGYINILNFVQNFNYNFPKKSLDKININIHSYLYNLQAIRKKIPEKKNRENFSLNLYVFYKLFFPKKKDKITLSFGFQDTTVFSGEKYHTKAIQKKINKIYDLKKQTETKIKLNNKKKKFSFLSSLALQQDIEEKKNTLGLDFFSSVGENTNKSTIKKQSESSFFWKKKTDTRHIENLAQLIKFICTLDQIKNEFLKKQITYKKFSIFNQQLKERKKLSILYGFLPKKQIQKLCYKANSLKGKLEDNLFFILEKRLDVTLFRIGFFFSIKSARQYISHKKVLVNGNIANVSTFSLKEGDILSIKLSEITKIQKLNVLRIKKKLGYGEKTKPNQFFSRILYWLFVTSTQDKINTKKIIQKMETPVGSVVFGVLKDKFLSFTSLPETYLSLIYTLCFSKKQKDQRQKKQQIYLQKKLKFVGSYVKNLKNKNKIQENVWLIQKQAVAKINKVVGVSFCTKHTKKLLDPFAFALDSKENIYFEKITTKNKTIGFNSKGPMIQNIHKEKPNIKKKMMVARMYDHTTFIKKNHPVGILEENTKICYSENQQKLLDILNQIRNEIKKNNKTNGRSKNQIKKSTVGFFGMEKKTTGTENLHNKPTEGKIYCFINFLEKNYKLGNCVNFYDYLKLKKLTRKKHIRNRVLTILRINLMKPLNVEICYRFLTAIYLYAPQKLKFSATIDTKKIVRSFN